MRESHEIGASSRSEVATQEEEQRLDDEPSSPLSSSRQATITWQDLKTNPGAVGLESVLYEIDKLRVLMQFALPTDLFTGVSPKVVALYRQRAATETLYELRRHPDATRYTLLAAFCQQRTGEVTDSLVDLLLLVIRRISAKAEKHVKKQYLDDIQTVEGKHLWSGKLPDATQAGAAVQLVMALKVDASLNHQKIERPAFGPISSHFQPRRHRLSSGEYCVILQTRFQSWDEITGVKMVG